MADTWNWVGATGRSYSYKVFELPVSFGRRQFGNYVVAKHGTGGRWIPVYVGEGDLGKHISPDHYKALVPAINRLEGYHVVAKNHEGYGSDGPRRPGETGISRRLAGAGH